MSGEVDESQHILPLDQPVVYLEAAAAFQGLTQQERLYAYHLSQAAWAGGLVTLVQTSIEAGPIFVMLHKLCSSQSTQEIRKVALDAGFTEDEVTALFVYTAGVFSNAGNYKGFGDTKFIPGIEKPRLGELLKLTSAWESISPIWEEYSDKMYDLSPGRTCLGFAPHGCTTYLSSNCTEKDNETVLKWLKSRGLECYNSRCFKTVENGKSVYKIRLASQAQGDGEAEEVDGCVFSLTKGDYSVLMKSVADNLEKAVEHASNDTQKDMLRCYVKSFRSGDLDQHKNGSRLWIKDKAPAIETYIGFIETYRDPAGMRGEFEGFVAAVNREMSAKFTNLVDSAEKLLPLLPWEKEFEKDKFLRPDFTSLDVLTFAGSGIPAGINIPNYDEIRQSEGFKNVSLGNVIPASYQQSNTPFLSESDKNLLQKYRVMSFEVQVGLHELLGHGSGKLLQTEKAGGLNYSADLIDPISQKPVASHYEPGDTYDSKFGPLGSAYEECRAEAVGLYLSLEKNVLKIFGHTDDADDIMYVNWLSLVWAGLCALEMWDAKRGWLQAHSQARFALMNVLIQAGVVTVTQPEPNDLLLTLNATTFKTEGRTAIGNFLLKLQIYKSTANIEAAQKLFHEYTDVVEPWLGWRDIVLANKRPRKMFTQPNMILDGSDVTLKAYESSPEGLIQSWVERFGDKEGIYKALLDITKADSVHF